MKTLILLLIPLLSGTLVRDPRLTGIDIHGPIGIPHLETRGEPILLLEEDTSPAPLLTLDSLSLSVGRPMTVKVEPWRPGPSDEVTVEISGFSSVPHLEAASVDVDIDGSFITIDIDWISNPPPPPPPPPRILTNNAVLFSVGIAHEEFPLPLTGNRGSREYEITESLGTFGPGDYNVEVNSYGVLTGTTTTTFTVREAASAVLGLPDPWSFVAPNLIPLPMITVD